MGGPHRSRGHPGRLRRRRPRVDAPRAAPAAESRDVSEELMPKSYRPADLADAIEHLVAAAVGLHEARQHSSAHEPRSAQDWEIAHWQGRYAGCQREREMQE